MRFSELKNRFKSRFNIRMIAGVLVFSLVGTGTYVCEAGTAKGNEVQDAQEESTLSEAIGESLTASEQEVGKEETVYIIAENTGEAKKVMVSEHLINSEREDVLQDQSELTEIENVKGDETFEQNGARLTWQADGNDIYYRGNSEKELPVTQNITYFLDGKEIDPKELAGKSGTVRIRFDYTNHTKESVSINGKEETVHVPFVAVSGLVLDDHFRNIRVTNGRTMTDGSRTIIIGYALPGLKDSLKIDETDFDSRIAIPDYFEVTAEATDFSLDMTMTVVTNAAGLSADGETGDLSSLEEMLDAMTGAMDQLGDGSAELAEGMDTLQGKLGEFSNGVNSLQSGLGAYTNGASQLADGAGQLKIGIDELAGNVPALADGVGQLKAGSSNAVNGANALRDGAGSLKEGSAQLKAGVDQMVGIVNGMGSQIEESKALYQQAVLQQAGVPYASADEVGAKIGELQGQRDALTNTIAAALNAGSTTIPLPDGSTQNVADLVLQLGQINAGLESLQKLYGMLEGGTTALSQVQSAIAGADTNGQLTQLQSGAAQVADGAAALSDGAVSLADGLAALDSGLGALNEKTGALSAGVTRLTDGANQLAGGSAELASQNGALMDGVSQLAGGTTALIDGAGTLGDGAHALADGIVTLNEEGIQRILDSYNGDMEPLMERIQAVTDAGNTYQSYAGIADEVSGSVRFVWRTEGV